MNKLLLPAAVALCAGVAFAKLPAPDDATKAKVAETAAKAAWQAKVDTFLLCKYQDKIAARYGKRDAKDARPPAAAAKPAASAASMAASGSGSTATPVTSSVPPPCGDPGPYAYNAPEQKPLETSGAHSPAGNAISPPSEKADSSQIQAPGKTVKK